MASTRATPPGQTDSLGRHAEGVRATVDRLSAERFLERCWAKDASLWTPEAAEPEDIRRRLGWLTIAEAMRPQVRQLRAFAEEIRAAHFTHAVLLGMGGSSLFPEVCRLTFGVAPGGVDVGVLDSTDPAAIRALERRAPLERTLAVISSKSGTTAEVLALTAYFYDRFKAAGGTPGDRCIAVTDHGTPLETLAKELRFRRTFILDPDTGQDIGGRFSALSYFGLVPAALLGLELDTLLDRGRDMLARCGPGVAAQENPALRLGAVLGALAGAGRDKVTFLFPAPLASFGCWLEQLIAESTGKSGKGIVPVVNEPLLEPRRYSGDRLFVVLQVTGQTDEAIERHASALTELGHPMVRIQLADRYDVGGEAMKWLLATTAAAGLLGVNPFSEPDVRESKALTNTLLQQYARDRRLPGRTPLASEGALAVYGAAGPASRTLADVFSAFFRLRKSGDYLALLSFLPRTTAADAALSRLRDALARQLDLATLLEIGPRYLHSTGQLYKGGRDCGLFLLLTAEECEDLAIPGEPFTFGALKYAQALGDFEAMQQKGRRILRVHLGGSPEQTLPQLQRALEAALVT